MLNTTKQCATCTKIKNVSEFHKNKSKRDGLEYSCKACSSEKNIRNKRSKKGIITTIYSHQKQHSKTRGHQPPTYTKQELKEWLYSQPLFHILYDNWKRLDFQKRYKPSVDRKNDYIGYTMNNIQIMTWGENDDKGHIDIRRGVNKKGCVAVLQYTKDGIFIKEFHSATEANKQTNINRSCIVTVCSNKKKTAGGFIWAYK